jgi:hypothetical protein
MARIRVKDPLVGTLALLLEKVCVDAVEAELRRRMR